MTDTCRACGAPSLDRVVDLLHDAWVSTADLPPDQRTGQLDYLIGKVGELLRVERPGFVDRWLDEVAP